MTKKAIGVFDSGLGGLTAVRELRKILPNETIKYFGDTGRVPYGTRSTETICKYTRQDMNFLMSKDVKIVVAACGTVSSNAKSVLDELPVPVITVIEPTALAAVNATKNGRIGVIATSATINSGAFKNEINKHNKKIEVFSKSCPLLVSLVENGFIEKDEIITKLVLERYLTSLIENDIDTLILGCTHYPILSDAIQQIVGEKVKLINSGKETAKYCLKVLSENDLLLDNKIHIDEFFVSDSVQNFYDIAKICLGEDIGSNVTKIEIHRY